MTVPDQQVDAMKDNYDHKANEKKVEQDSESGDKNTAPKDKPEEPLKSAANEVADTIAVPSAAAKDEKPLISGPLEEVKPLDPEHGVELEKETGGKDDDKPASAVEVKQSHHFDPEAGNAETLPAVGATNVAQGNAATVEVAEAPGRQVNDEVEKGTEVNDKLDENMQKDGVAADEQEEQQEEQKEESDDDFERIEDISCPTLDFSNAPQSSEPLTALEERIRNISIAAHNHLSRDKLT